MYRFFRDLCERVLRIPLQPEPPPGDEASARVFRAAPQYFKYRLVLWAIGTALAVGVTLFGLGIVNFGVTASVHRDHGSSIIPVIVAGLSLLVLALVVAARLFSLAVLRIDYEKRWYVVTDRSLRVREGVVIVREMTITFANVQNLSISQGPIQRALRIADLVVETAGGGAMTHRKEQPGLNLHTACFRGVDNAPEIKELIQQRLRALKDSGLGDHEEMRARGIAERSASSSLVEALRAVHAEAAALRRTLAA
jgi:uncharacterized membrane protein YdbT with pleckstrin-like domain